MATPQIVTSTYKPLDWQIDPWRDKSPVLLLTGSAGGGKSRIAAEKMHALMLKYPGATGIIGRKDKTAAGKSVVPFMLHTVMGDTTWGEFKITSGLFNYHNGSQVWVVGLADGKQREALRSIGKDGQVDFAWFEEANKLTEDDHNEILGRMRGTAADWRQVIYSTNPDTPTHWIYTRLIVGNEASVYTSKALDNIHNPDDYIDTLGKLTGVLKQRLVEGLWIQAEGAVYDEFDTSIHLIDRFEIPKDWRRIRVVDFGYTNPFTCLWIALDNDDRAYIYREIYMTQRLVSQHAKQINTLSEEELIEVTIADHDAEDRATLESEGIYTQLAVKDISPGIQAVKQRLAISEDGKPRLFYMRGSLVELDESLAEAKRPTSTIDEFPGYVWPKTQDGKPIKETQVKENDHGMDAIRYAMKYLDQDIWFEV